MDILKKYPNPLKALDTIGNIVTGLMLHGGNDSDCLHAPWSMPWCPFPFKNEANRAVVSIKSNSVTGNGALLIVQ